MGRVLRKSAAAPLSEGTRPRQCGSARLDSPAQDTTRMSLTLYMHPLSSFCHKVLIALYENSIPFEPQVIDLLDPAVRDEYRKVWPFAKFPVLRDSVRSRTVPESTVIIEYLARHHAGPVKLVPDDAELAWQVRAVDRFYDLHLHEPMQKIV